MSTTKTITISLPEAMGKEMQHVAKEEHRTISELVREAFRQYQSRRNLQGLARTGRRAVRRRGLTPNDFGGPFEE